MVVDPPDEEKVDVPKEPPSSADAEPTAAAPVAGASSVATLLGAEPCYKWTRDPGQPLPSTLYNPGGNGEPFDAITQRILVEPIPPNGVDITPEGELRLNEIGVRRAMLRAFGPGGWSLLAEEHEEQLKGYVLSREYSLWVHGRFVAQASGEYRLSGKVDSWDGTTEKVRSSALINCCKDLGVGFELENPDVVKNFKVMHCERTKKGRGYVWQKKPMP
ncbi:hypothetical protein HK101_010856 [Irineochytrium annulatum]|nr:hypothetical protein HK101_010856 [Irineochytrium annulatum]